MFGFYGHRSKLHSDHMMKSFNGSGENCANSCGSRARNYFCVSSDKAFCYFLVAFPANQQLYIKNFLSAVFESAFQ